MRKFLLFIPPVIAVGILLTIWSTPGQGSCQISYDPVQNKLTCTPRTGGGGGGTPITITSGAGDPADGACTSAPSGSGAQLYFDTTAKVIWMCREPGQPTPWSKILATNNSGQFVLTGLGGSTPAGTTAAGEFDFWYDSTARAFKFRDEDEVVRTLAYATIATTTSVLVGDGSGNAVAAAGSPSDCVHVDGSSGACGGTADLTDPATLMIWETFVPGSAADLSLGVYDWNISSLSTTPTMTAGDGVHWRGINLLTGAVADSTSSIDLSGITAVTPFPNLATSVNWTVYFKVKTPAALTETLFAFGLRGTAASNALSYGNDITIRYWNSTGCDNTNRPNATDTTWRYQTTQTSSANRTLNDGPAIATSTDYWFRIRSTQAGHILFSGKPEGTDWSSETDVTSNVPTSNMVPYFAVATCNTTAKTMVLREFRAIVTGLN